MKRMTLFFLLMLLVVGVWTVQAETQNVVLDWFSAEGSTALSTGGAFSLASTAGQHDAGVLSNAAFSMTGGYSTPATAFVPTAVTVASQTIVEQSAIKQPLIWLALLLLTLMGMTVGLRTKLHHGKVIQ